MDQREIDINDIQNVIRYGRIVEHSKPLQLWRYATSARPSMAPK